MVAGYYSKFKKNIYVVHVCIIIMSSFVNFCSQHVLEWIEMALQSSAQEDQGQDLYISKRTIMAALSAIRKTPVQEIMDSIGSNDQLRSGKLDLYSAAVILMNEVHIFIRFYYVVQRKSISSRAT